MSASRSRSSSPTSRYIAEDAAALVEVDYEPLPAVADCRAALDAGRAARASRTRRTISSPNSRSSYGDVDAAFAGAAHVFRESIGSIAAAAIRSNAAASSPRTIRSRTG